jgi:hypothetical protein
MRSFQSWETPVRSAKGAFSRREDQIVDMTSTFKYLSPENGDSCAREREPLTMLLGVTMCTLYGNQRADCCLCDPESSTLYTSLNCHAFLNMAA